VGFSALILLVLFRPWRQRVARADLLATARYGVVLGLMNLSFYMALRSIPLGLAIAIEFLGPLTVSLIHSRKPAHFAAVGMAAAGLALLLPVHGGMKGLDPVGVGFALGAGLGWGLYIIFGKRLGHLHGGQAVAMGMSAAALVVVPIGIHAQGMALLNPSLMAVGIIAGGAVQRDPYSLEIVALKAIPAGRFGVLVSVEPAVGALAGAVLLGEHLAAPQVLAIALVVLASVGSVIASERERAAQK
jgi:inner membrane transporter RhtA